MNNTKAAAIACHRGVPVNPIASTSDNIVQIAAITARSI